MEPNENSADKSSDTSIEMEVSQLTEISEKLEKRLEKSDSEQMIVQENEKSDDKTEDNSGDKSEDRNEEKSEDRSEEKSEEKSKDKIEDKSEDKGEDKSEDKNKDKSEDKSKDKSEEKSENIDSTNAQIDETVTDVAKDVNESPSKDNAKTNTPQNNSQTKVPEKREISVRALKDLQIQITAPMMNHPGMMTRSATPIPVKRKRKSQITPTPDQNGADGKRKKLDGQDNDSDKYCWRCHKESVDAQCSNCPRSWHRRCMGGAPPLSVTNWVCAECTSIVQAEDVETRSVAMKLLTVDQLCMMLRHVIERMKDQTGSAPFWRAVDLNEVPNYLEYVVRPMDLNLLESNVRSKMYISTEAFMADARWIQHNCIVFNTCGGVYADTSKLTNTARQMLRVARQEVSEIESCPDCFAHGRNIPRPLNSWFIEPCRRPHPIVWAKLKGFPFWPAKAMPRLNPQGLVDVRFFGEHDRAWVSPKDIFLYSPEPPMPLPKKKKSEMEQVVQEVDDHCKRLEQVFGEFRMPPPKIQYDPLDTAQIKILLPKYKLPVDKRKDYSRIIESPTNLKSPVSNIMPPPATTKIPTPANNKLQQQSSANNKKSPATNRMQSGAANNRGKSPANNRGKSPANNNKGQTAAANNRVNSPANTKAQAAAANNRINSPANSRAQAVAAKTRVNSPANNKVQATAANKRVNSPANNKGKSPAKNRRKSTMNNKSETTAADGKEPSPTNSRDQSPANNKTQTPANNKVQTLANDKAQPPEKAKTETPVSNKTAQAKMDPVLQEAKIIVVSATNGMIENSAEKRKVLRKKPPELPQDPLKQNNSDAEPVTATSTTVPTTKRKSGRPTTPAILKKGNTPQVAALQISNSITPSKNATPMRKLKGDVLKKIKLLQGLDKDDLKKIAVLKSVNDKTLGIKSISGLNALNNLQSNLEAMKALTPGQKTKTVLVATMKKPGAIIPVNAKIKGGTIIPVNVKSSQFENKLMGKIVMKSGNKDSPQFTINSLQVKSKEELLSGRSMTAIPMIVKKDQSKAVHHIGNSNTSESAKHFSDKDMRLSSAVTLIKQEPKDDVQPRLTIARKSTPSKARKSLPSRPPNFTQVPPSAAPSTSSTSSCTSAPSSSSSHQLSKSNPVNDTMVYVSGQGNKQQQQQQRAFKFPPSEAGPETARIYQNSKEVANRVAQLITDLIKDAGEGCGDGTAGNSEATIHYLKLRMERMKWEHQQEINEIRQNNEMMMREMKANMEIERARLLHEAHRDAEVDKKRCVEETKRKQWCVVCGREAMFYCCWNTAYCDYPCQQKHWGAHMASCAQKINPATPTSNQQINRLPPGVNSVIPIKTIPVTTIPTTMMTVPIPTPIAIVQSPLNHPALNKPQQQQQQQQQQQNGNICKEIHTLSSTDFMSKNADPLAL